jgi:hypothetical protein
MHKAEREDYLIAATLGDGIGHRTAVGPVGNHLQLLPRRLAAN